MRWDFRGLAERLIASVMVCCWAYASGANPVPTQYSEAYRAAQQWNSQPSMSTDPVTFSLIGVPYHEVPKNAKCCESLPEHEDEFRQIQYRVPRNYLVQMDKWNGGP